MTLRRRLAILAAACAATCAVPAVAAANTAWVSTSPVKAPFTSCASPGFNTIQAAISTGSTTTVHVCTGTYVEQLVILRALSIVADPSVKVELPASPSGNTTPCKLSAEEQDVVAICTKNAAETVKISGLTIEGTWPAGTCNEDLYGVIVGGGGNLVLSKSKVLGAGAHPINGCQGGIGVEIGKKSGGLVGTATLSEIEIAGYQKNGVTVDGKGSKATIKTATVTGEPSDKIAQNGIQVSRGAEAKISSSTIEGNECNDAKDNCGADSLKNVQATGVLFFEAAPGASVTGATINNNDIGVYHYAEKESASPQVLVTGNKLENRYEGVVLDQGVGTVNKNTINGGNVGIQLIQYAGQAFGPKGTGSGDTITGAKQFAVEGLSDKLPADEFGTFTITKSKISGNPGPTPAESVYTNNPKRLQIITTPSDT